MKSFKILPNKVNVMQKTLFLFCLGSLGMIIVFFTLINIKDQNPANRKNNVSPSKEIGLSKYDRMDLAMELEFKKTVDPALGYIPRERLAIAYEQAKRNQNRRAVLSGVEWKPRGPINFGGRTRAIMFDPNDANHRTVYAGSVGGGLWKTTDIYDVNPNWEPVDDLFDNLAVVSMAYDPSNTLIMYFGTGEGFYNGDAVRGDGVWKTTDGGSTWSQLANTTGTDFDYVNSLVVTDNGTVLAACRSISSTSGGILRSTDGGTNWSTVAPSSGNHRAADIEVAENGDLYAGLGIFNTRGVWKSTDDGASFSELTGVGLPSSGFERIELACAPSDSNTVLAIYQDDTNLDCYGMYQTSDGGASWNTIVIPTNGGADFTNGQSWYNLMAAYDPLDSSRIIIGGLDMYLTEDEGSSWTMIGHWFGDGVQEVHADHHGIYFLPGSSDTVLFGNDGGVYLSEDASLPLPEINDKSANYQVLQFYSCAIHPTANENFFLAGAQDNGSHRFTKAGLNATTEVTGGDGAFVHIDQDDPDYMFTSYVYNYFRRSTDGGTTFLNINHSGTGQFINPSDYDNDEQTMYAAYTFGRYLRWNNPRTGTNFSNMDMGFTDYVSAVTVDPNTSNRVWFGVEDGSVYYVSNAHIGSASSNDVTDPSMPGTYISCIEIDPTDATHVLVTFSSYGVSSVWETTNTGSSWTEVEGNLPDMPVRWALFNPNNTDQALLATEAGVWSTDNLNGASTVWGASNTGMANVRTDMLQYRSSDNLVVASTHGRGLFTSDVFTTVDADFGSDKTVAYIAKDIQFYDNSYKATSWFWTFGDGNISTNGKPTHAYSNAGVYDVTLSVNSGAASITKTGYITVLPDRDIPYELADGGNFEVNINDFGPENWEGTPFERGNSSVSGKNGVNSSSNAWVTDISASNYENHSHAELLTPNYDFLSSGTYTLDFYANFDLEYYSPTEAYDGFRLEYTLDKGDNWYLLGTGSFYNYNNTLFSTSFPYGEPYFSGSSGGYTNYTLDVSSFAGNANVAFKFVFKTDNTVIDPGAAIDDFTIDGPPPAILPVAILDFNAINRYDHAFVYWEIDRLQDLDYFELERSGDGKQFSKLTGVNKKAEKSHYNYQDFEWLQGINYYRLKIFEIDGSVKYSPIKVIHFKSDNLEVEIFPNPVNNLLNGFLYNPEINKIEFSIYDISGKHIEQTHIEYDAGRHAFSFDVSDYPQGTYFMVLKSGTVKHIMKFLKY